MVEIVEQLKPRVVILGAGRPRGDGKLFGLQEVTPEQRVLDWQLAAFERVNATVEFVGGYRIDDVIAAYPDLIYRYNQEWRESGCVSSLAGALDSMAPEEYSDLYIVYCDILITAEVVDLLRREENDCIAIGVDTSSSSKRGIEAFEGSGQTGEFGGIGRVS